MSRHPHPIPLVPEETARVARTAFPHGNVSLLRRDARGTLFTDDDVAALVPTRGQPPEAPWRLALVPIRPDVEEVSERQAAEAVRSRMDWQDALSRERTDPGFDSTGFSALRARVVVGSADQRLLDALLASGRARQWRKARGRQRPDSTPGLARGRAVKRCAWVGETLRHPRHSRAVVAPEWLHTHGQAVWQTRDGRRVEDDRWPTRTADRHAYAPVSGADGSAVWSALDTSHAPAWVREVPAVET
jgi:transposase